MLIIRKLGVLGYNRSAKKCREKFENVFKYHKRTKDGRTSKGQGKTYRFFDQLEAFQHHHPSLHQSPSPKSQAPAAAAAAAVSIAMPLLANPAVTTVPSTAQMANSTVPAFQSTTTTTPTNLSQPPQGTNVNNPSNYPSQSNIPSAIRNISTDLLSNWTSSSSSSTSSDLELEGGRRRRRKRKRKWRRDFFERLMKEVVDKQEELQKKFLEAIEKREHERTVREEAWRKQEMTRINREREILAQERSIAAAKDAAVMAFLQKLAEQQQNPGSSSGQVTISNNIIPPILPQPTPDPAPAPIPSQPPPPPPPKPLSSTPPALLQLQPVFSMETMKRDNGESNYYMPASPSRWPKIEVEALIKLRTDLDSKYQENGPKGPLWEEISAGMRRLGYNRNPKRCKEKWENINKYFKKVKESNKKRPEDSKTCPYFHQLDALYKDKNKHDSSSSNRLLLFKPENSVPLMVEPEQQWPPRPEHHQQQQEDEAMDDDTESDDQNVEEDDKDGDDEDEDDGGDDFEVVANK